MLVQRKLFVPDIASAGAGTTAPDATPVEAIGDPVAETMSSGTQKRMVVGAITIAAHELVAHAERTSGVAAGRVRMLMVWGGPVRIASHPEPIEVGDGQGLLVNGTASVRMSSQGAGEIVTVGMPVEALPELSLPRNSAMLIRDAALLRPISAFVQTLFEGDPLDVLAREHVERLLREMILIAVRGTAGERGPHVAPSLHQRTIAVLQRRHPETGLTPSEVAAEVSISLRQLEREFQREGRTIRQELRRVRVAAAVAMLQDERRAGETVDSVAARVGLSNGSSLARAISAEGFPSPSALRATAAVRDPRS